MKLGKIGRTTMGVSFPEELITDLQMLAHKDRRPVGFIVREACAQYVQWRKDEEVRIQQEKKLLADLAKRGSAQ